MLNPSCPDTSRSRTFKAIERVAVEAGARNLSALNLLSRRAGKTELAHMTRADLLASAADAVSTNRSVIARAVAQSDLVILAHGHLKAQKVSSEARELLLGEESWLEGLLQRAGVSVAQLLHGPLHPSRWDQIVNSNADVKAVAVKAGLAGLLRRSTTF